MKKQLLKSALIAVASIGLLAGSAMALPTTGTLTVSHGTNEGGNDGGEFLLTVGDSNYIGFCLEISEHVNYNNIYNFTASDVVTSGGPGATIPEGGDRLDYKTEWAMFQYVNNYDWFKNLLNISENDALAAAMQVAIWFFEEEINTDNSLYLTYQTAINTISEKATDQYGNFVTALNLTSNRTMNQSMLIADPVPEPATMLLFGTGIMALASVARRKRD
jgi:hypothetical protein